MPGQNFDLVSELQACIRRDFPLADSTLLNPLNTIPLVDGEWMELNSSYQLARGTGESALPSWPVHTERGRYDTQAIGKANVLYMGMYEADTTVCDISGATLGGSLTVQDVTFLGQNHRGLKLKAGGVKMVVGFITKLYGSTVKLRVAHFAYGIQA
jgi:hypothetical protein